MVGVKEILLMPPLKISCISSPVEQSHIPRCCHPEGGSEGFVLAHLDLAPLLKDFFLLCKDLVLECNPLILGR